MIIAGRNPLLQIINTLWESPSGLDNSSEVYSESTAELLRKAKHLPLDFVECQDLPPFQYIYSIEFANQFIGYAGAASGVYKTEGGGGYWVLLENSPACQVNDLEVINTLTVYAATNDTMYVTNDGGTSWIPINEGIMNPNIFSLCIHPASSQTLLAGGEWSIYKTTDGGVEWSEIIKGFKILNLKVLEFGSNTFDYIDKKTDYNDVSVFSQQTYKDLK